MITVDNLFHHADGGYYCLLSDDAPLKNPATGDWLEGVIYIGIDGKMRSTTQDRWADRFVHVPVYEGDNTQVLDMIRRCNPGSESGFDFMTIFESWQANEISVTGSMLELAVAAVLVNLVIDPSEGDVNAASITITTEELQRIAQNYEIFRVPLMHGFDFQVRRSEIISA